MVRRLRPEEIDLWRRVTNNTTPLSPERIEASTSEPRQRPRVAEVQTPIPSFRIGEAPASTMPPKVHVRPPLRIDRRTQKDLSRGRRRPEASIDLHGMTLEQAHPALNRFILASFATGRRLVLVITGKGGGSETDWHAPRGVLRRQVPDWLSGAPLGSVVQEILPAHRSHGGSGAYYVVLRRN